MVQEKASFDMALCAIKRLRKSFQDIGAGFNLGHMRRLLWKASDR
jgi:hypothetical protein